MRQAVFARESFMDAAVPCWTTASRAVTSLPRSLGRDQMRATSTERTNEGRELSRRDRDVFLAKWQNPAHSVSSTPGLSVIPASPYRRRSLNTTSAPSLPSQDYRHFDGSGIASRNQDVFHQHVTQRPGCAR